MLNAKNIVVGVQSDDPFTGDIAHYMKQEVDVSDILSYKEFANTEFCPRFISDESDFDHIGHGLDGKTVIIVSACSGNLTRNARAMRTFLVARAAKDNGAERVILIEPDLFYSAQDRGPRPEYGRVAFQRSVSDYKKFDGQPWSAMLYAQLLKTAGVDKVMTVHNHSVAVMELFTNTFNGYFYNLSPAGLYASYLANHASLNQPVDEQGIVICAPDKGATPFAQSVMKAYEQEIAKDLISRHKKPEFLVMSKERLGERQVVIKPADNSPITFEQLKGREVVVCDDMVRTGGTIMACCKQLKAAGARRVLFVVTHFYSSQEVKENLGSDVIDEIVTTDTLPNILNRDMQGRLRKKILVLKLERWIVNELYRQVLNEPFQPYIPPYSVDISHKNPNWINNQALRDMEL
ncbi:MAG: ribose-phosphate pyrophosphokinase [Victivallales bacterium]|nr:ribose-phosphate pyrophosphokinase [Victivallales bacterium]